jgi:hypothetical protein
MTPVKPILLTLFLFSISTAFSQDVIISVNKCIKTELFPDSTTSFNMSEFTSISPLTFFGFNFTRTVPVVMYSKAENVYDSTNAFKIASIKGDVSAYFMEEGIRFEDVFTALNYDKLKERLIGLQNIDTKKDALIIFSRRIKGLANDKYPYLIYIEKIGNRLSSTIFNISKTTIK